jgi:hypothetical protein
MRRTLITTTAFVLGALVLAREAAILALYFLGGVGWGRAKKIAKEAQLAAFLDGGGTERKVLLFEWLVTGTVGKTLGIESVLELFGTDYYQETDPDGYTGEYLYVHLAERYDETTGALFHIGAELDLDGQRLYFLTTYAPLAAPGGQTVYTAVWPDATTALMSYYGSGESERAGVGLVAESEDEDAA